MLILIKEVIVVEGKDDTVAVQRAVKADTIETGGSAIDQTILEQIRLAHERRGVIVLTDPDHAGERIRNLISHHVPGCKHAFILRDQAMSKHGVGVEHASAETIRAALEKVKTEHTVPTSEISWADLIEAGLIHHADAFARRKEMGALLHIGVCNGKQFYKRLSKFQITREEFIEAWKTMESKAGGT